MVINRRTWDHRPRRRWTAKHLVQSDQIRRYHAPPTSLFHVLFPFARLQSLCVSLEMHISVSAPHTFAFWNLNKKNCLSSVLDQRTTGKIQSRGKREMCWETQMFAANETKEVLDLSRRGKKKRERKKERICRISFYLFGSRVSRDRLSETCWKSSQGKRSDQIEFSFFPSEQRYPPTRPMLFRSRLVFRWPFQRRP